MYLNVTVVHQKWYHLSLVDPDLMVCRLLNVNIDMYQGTSSKLSTQVLVNEKNRIRQHAGQISKSARWCLYDDAQIIWSMNCCFNNFWINGIKIATVLIPQRTTLYFNWNFVYGIVPQDSERKWVVWYDALV